MWAIAALHRPATLRRLAAALVVAALVVLAVRVADTGIVTRPAAVPATIGAAPRAHTSGAAPLAGVLPSFAAVAAIALAAGTGSMPRRSVRRRPIARFRRRGPPFLQVTKQSFA